ncbi:unnamed protein product [Brassicogethes aeneus]|uniref:Fibronectin type-III domain-containing protein n=1 Tax=Brassicogethes aeneus TaxID=1431903 RepID=A0A9P0FHX0_BRAAE|nr:unnamed protein product [Brassicogethes aeneus]
MSPFVLLAQSSSLRDNKHYLHRPLTNMELSMYCLLLVYLVGVTVHGDTRELIPLEAPENLTLIDIGERDVMIMWSPVNKLSVRGTFRGYIIRVWNHVQKKTFFVLYNFVIVNCKCNLFCGCEENSRVAMFSRHMQAVFKATRQRIRKLRTQTQVYAVPPDVTTTNVQFFPYSKNFITVSVRNEKYVGPRSTAIRFDAPQTEPSYPYLFEWHQLGNDSVLLQWNKPKQPNGILIGYNIYTSKMKPSGGIDEKSTIHQSISDPNKFQTKVTGLKEGVKYQVDLAAVNCAGESEHNSIEMELEQHTPETPSIPFFKYKIDYKPMDSLNECIKPTVPIVTVPPKVDIDFNDFDDDYFVFNETETGKIVRGTTTKKPKTTTKKIDTTHDPCIVDCMITWMPDVDDVPGEHFYVKYRQRGLKDFNTTDPIKNEDFVILKKFNGCQSYEIVLVTVDGDHETESDLQMTPAVLFMTYF